jgi:HTH-type transcriptional regulator / antitoxin HigA
MASSVRFEPDYAIAPAGTLRATLTSLGMTQSQLAERTGLSLKHINQIVQGNAPITAETALLLERATSVPARMWNSLEATYREQVARRENRKVLARDPGWLKLLPLVELVRRGHVTEGADKGTQVEEVLRFFGVADRKRWERVWLAPLASFRQSPSFAADAGAVATWLRLGEIAAEQINCEPFSAKQFREALAEIRTLTVEDPGEAFEKVVELCSAAGVAVVFVADIGKTRASGAARWLTPTKALIQLSLRHKSDDHLWFSFFHEAAHLLHHSKKETFVSSERGSNETEEMENEANAFAASQLIPRRYEPRLRDLRTEADVRNFADDIGLAPGIVVGRLQKEELWGWGKGNRLKRRLELTED